MSKELNRLYKFSRFIQKGTDASVFLVIYRESNEKRALKVIRVQDLEPTNMFSEHFILEAKIMIDLKDVKGVPKLHHVFRENPISFGGVPRFDSFVLAMSIPPNKYTELVKHFFTKKSNMRKAHSQLSRILKDLNDRHIAHNDLHSSNVLIETDFLQVTLIDFGRAQYKNKPYGFIDNLRNWTESPPELRDQGIFNYDSSTTWTFGRLMLDKYVRNPKAPYPLIAKYKSVPPMLKDLLSKIFVPYEKRIPLVEVFKHPYFDLSKPEDYSACGGDIMK